MIAPSDVAFFAPGHLKTFKQKLFDRIGRTIEAAGGAYVRGDFDLLAHKARKGRIPVVGCTPELRPLIDEWRASGHPWVYWDRGYVRRVFATDLPVGSDGGFYRWHVNAYQMREVREVPPDRWAAAATPLRPWAKSGRHIVIAEPSRTYERFHGIEGWTERAIEALRKVTDRPIVRRDKEMQAQKVRTLRQDLAGAHCLVTHGSNAAVEAAIYGCPIFVHPDSAAAHVGLTNLSLIETPAYPDREPWARSLAYSQFCERELVDGTLWKLLT